MPDFITMLNDETIKDLHRAFQKSPSGFVVVDSGKPRFAVLDYDTYEIMTKKNPNPKPEEAADKKGKKGKILVTGGAGYIGSHTVRLLQNQGFEVVVYDNLSTGRAENARGCELVEADILDSESLNQVFARHSFDAVMHFAAAIEVEESVRNPDKYFENNVLGGVRVLEAMRRHGVNNLVFSSTCAVYGSPDKLPVTEQSPYLPESPYGLTKMLFEVLLRWYQKSHGVNSVSLRYFNAAGAWPEEDLGFRTEDNTLLIPQIMRVASGLKDQVTVFGQDYNTPDGTAVRDYVHVLDVAEAHIAALEKLWNTNGAYFYNIGTGKGSTVLEVIEAAVEATGRMVPMEVTERRPGDAEKLWADTKRANQDLGWQARRGLEEIVRDAWQWVQTANHNR